MRYLDICSGISAPTMAWKPLGWQALCFAEIEAAPRAVLAHHYPNVPLVGDFTQIRGDEYGSVDLLVGGTPCQDFSVAGLRAGLDGERGNLTLEYLRLADRARPRWLVWENVPGVLSIDEGRAFGAILGAMGELGYGYAYRVLDAQHFGVPQRRRRVFVVGHLGDWRRAAAVLFERHSLSGHPAPSREKGQNAPTLPSRSSAGGGLGTDFDCDGGLIETCPTLRAGANVTGGHRPPGTDVDTADSLIPMSVCREVAASLTSNYGKQPDNSDTGLGPNLIAIQERAVSENPDAGPDGAGFRQDGQAYTLEARTVPQAVAFADCFNGTVTGDTSPTMGTRGSSTNSSGPTLMQSSAVRRLTPRECERLQGFPDDFTLVPYRKGMMADGPRYKMLGNSMAVPVIRWIGERIALVDALDSAKSKAA